MCFTGKKTKVELPGLLPAGQQRMSVDDLKALVVDGFPKSTRRSMLWQNFLGVVALLRAAALPCDIWLDGSFLTQKIDPDDVDFVVDIPIHIFDNPTPAQREIIQQIGQQAFCNIHLDSYVMPSAPLGHINFAASNHVRDQWKRDFGEAFVSKTPKGIAVIGVLS